MWYSTLIVAKSNLLPGGRLVHDGVAVHQPVGGPLERQLREAVRAAVAAAAFDGGRTAELGLVEAEVTSLGLGTVLREDQDVVLSCDLVYNDSWSSMHIIIGRLYGKGSPKRRSSFWFWWRDSTYSLA